MNTSLCGSGAALHTIQNHHIGPSLHGKRCVVIGARTADLDVDRLFPIGDLAQLKELDLQIVGAVQSG